MNSVIINSVYETSDSKVFHNKEESQKHQAHIELALVLNGSVLSELDRNMVLSWFGDNKKVISNFLYPHNVALERNRDA